MPELKSYSANIVSFLDFGLDFCVAANLGRIIDKILHRIDEGFFNFVEDQDSCGKDADRHGERDAKITYSANTLTNKYISDSDDWHFHRIERGDPTPFFRDLRDGINDRGGIHPELNDGGGEESEIAVFRRKGRKPEADAEREGGDLKND